MVGHALENLFGKSPIKPLQQHIQTVVACAQLLKPFIQSTFANDWQQAESCYEAIRDKEHAADDLKKHIRLNLPRSFFMPIARNDLLTLVSRQDKIANITKDIAGLMLGRGFPFPSSLEQQVMDFVEAAIATAVSTEVIIDELDELLEAGFSGPELELAKQQVVDLDKLEDKADRLEISLRQALKSIESELPPVDVMFLYKSISLIGILADEAQRVGDQLYIIIAR